MAAKRQDPHVSHGDRVDVRRRAWRAAMVTTSAVADVLDRELRSRTEVDLQTYDAMLHVFEAGNDGIRMTDLARKIVLSRAGLTSLVDRLERRGLVRRDPDPDDRRTIRIRLTEEGATAFRAAAEVHVQGIEQHFGSLLDDEEARIIASALERVHAQTVGGGAR